MDVLSWLLEGDPSVRWQVMRDLTDASPEQITRERARVATDGWGAALLAARDHGGGWAGGAFWPSDFSEELYTQEGQAWTATFHTMWLLVVLGIDPAGPGVADAIAGAATMRWEEGNQAFFDGEVEPCINGRTVGIGSYFGRDMTPVVERLLGERLADGGWNCEAPHNSSVTSFDTTINVLEGLSLYAAAHPDPRVDEAIACATEYLLERHLFKGLRSGVAPDPVFVQSTFPMQWRYTTLRAMDWMRSVGMAPDQRIGDALDLLRSKQRPDGRWDLDLVIRGRNHLTYEVQGEPSRWVTMQALRVLRWAASANL